MALAPHADPFYSDGTTTPDQPRIGVLLSHGFTGSPASMTPWGQYLAEQGFAVSVPRLPGHGTTWQDMSTTTWEDWYAELVREFQLLRERTDMIVVGGLSMGGTLALKLASAHPEELAGLMLVNPAVASTNKQLLAVPLLKHVVKAMPGIGNDIKKEGVSEYGYDKTPLRPLDSMMKAWKDVRASLPGVTCPVILFRSAEDHVVDPSSARIILGEISSRDASERVLENSFHVATLDNDAQVIFEESAEFIRRVTAA